MKTEWIDSWYECPYCGDQVGEHSGCCGEYGHTEEKWYDNNGEEYQHNHNGMLVKLVHIEKAEGLSKLQYTGLHTYDRHKYGLLLQIIKVKASGNPWSDPKELVMKKIQELRQLPKPSLP